MLAEIGNAVIAQLNAMGGLKQVGYYEGQFDDLDNYAVYPPAIFIDYQAQDGYEADSVKEGAVRLTLHLAASSLAKEVINNVVLVSPNNAISLIDTIKNTFHNTAIVDPTTGYNGLCRYGGFRYSRRLPNIVIYEVYITVYV